MPNFVRDSFWGRVVYHLSHRKLLNYAEEKEDYVLPDKYDPLVAPKEKLQESASTISNEAESTETKTDPRIIVTWDGDDDPENPYNWSTGNKVLVVFMVGILTAFVYMASAIYTPGIDEIMEAMDVGHVVATLPLTLFVFGYSLGPMVFSPLSENARLGRTSLYILTLFVFFILQIPTALVTDIASLCVLRFLAGFFASPCLATGGATIGDVTAMAWVPVSIAGWAAGAFCAPTLGPLFGAVLVKKVNYHWPFWFVAITSGTLFLTLSFFLPETSGKTILYRKAERIRALTGNQDITSEGHTELESMSMNEMLVSTFWRPIEIILFEPVVLLIDLYIGLIYAIFYLWFEAFPIVYYQTYNFTLVELGASYLSIIVAMFVGLGVYLPFIYSQFTKKLLAGEPLTPEVFLPMTIVGSVLMPLGLIIFAWTATPSVHWIVSMIGVLVFIVGAYIVFQTLFNYLSMSFWRYLASVFAGNGLFRGSMGAAFPLFGKAMFDNLATEKYPVAWGTMILAFLSMLMILIPVFFYKNGPKLRARSKYAN